MLSCARQKPEPQALYDAAERLFLRGDLAHARTQAHSGYEQFADNNPAWAWNFRLLEAEVMTDQGLGQDVLVALNSEPAQASSNAELSVRRHMLRALAFAHLGDFQHAHRDLEAALALCQEWNCENAGKLARIAGAVAVDESRLDEATRYFFTSMRIARERQDRFLEVSAQLNLGVTTMGSEHFDESIGWLDQAQASARKIGAELDAEKALGTLGWDYYKLGDFERARENYQAAVQTSEHLGAVKDETIWLNNIGLVYFQTKAPERADEYYQQSLRLAEQAQNRERILDSLNALSFLAIEAGHLGPAGDYSRQAFELASKSGDRLDQLPALLAEAQIAARSRDELRAEQLFTEVAHDTVSDTSLRWEAENSLAKLFEAENRVTRAKRQYREALSTVEQARAAIQHEDFRLPFLSNAAHLYDDYINFLIKQGKTREALEQADYSRAQTLAEGLRVKKKETLVAPSSPRPQQLAQRNKSTILFYWLGPEHAYLWAITPTQIRLFPLPPTSEIEAKVEHYNQALIGPRDPLDTGNPDGADLYRILVEPAQSLIRPGSRVIILPDGRLNTLNFETLLVSEPKPHYWIEDVTVETAPALRLLEASNSRRKRSEKLLLIGDPIQADKSFGDLPNAWVEVDEIEKHFSPADRQAYVRDQATPEAYLSSHPEQFAFIHFVAHGTASRLTPLESGVVLSKPPNQDAFKLYAREIVAHPLDAELVTVSACNGAGTRYYTGEGLVGLSWAFLRAGAHHVIGALWEVNDRSTPALMDQLYADLEKGLPPRDALHAAKLRMLHSQGVYRKPYYWAPFQLYMGS